MGEKSQTLFLKAQDDVLKCVVSPIIFKRY